MRSCQIFYMFRNHGECVLKTRVRERVTENKHEMEALPSPNQHGAAKIITRFPYPPKCIIASTHER